METGEENKELRAERMVHNFKRKFKEEFGTDPFVRYSIKTRNTAPLEIILEAANRVLNSMSAYFYTEGIATTYHDDNVLTCRWIYYKLAEVSGYSKTQMANIIKQTPQSVGYGLGKITKLTKNDTEERKLCEQIKKEIETIMFRSLETNGDVNK